MADEEHTWKERGLRDAVLRGDMEAWRVLYDQCFDSLFAFIDFRSGRRRDRTCTNLQRFLAPPRAPRRRRALGLVDAPRWR